MSFVNGYQPPAEPKVPESPDFGPEPYDLNFCLSIDFSQLESDRVKLVPFIPRLHAQIYVDEVTQHPELESLLPFRTQSTAHLCSLIENRFRQNTAFLPFAVIDKGRPDPAHPEWGGSMAGVTGLLKADPDSLCIEIGWVVTFPAFQRTYVTSNANAILLRYLLATPDEQPHRGLGMRRVQWFANAKNAPSVAAAVRLGFKMEGTLRWERALPPVHAAGGHGRPIRQGDPRPEMVSRDSALLSCCADDWENGGRELIQKLIDRR